MNTYEKKYKEAIERASKLRVQNPFDTVSQMMEYLFPELKESEDEESKKWILEYLYDGLRKSDEQFKGQFKAAIAWLEKQAPKNKTALDKAIEEEVDAWLEKQGEQKLILDVEISFGAKDSELEEVSYSIPDGYHAEIEDNKIVIKKGEQKPTKVEPKFKVGDTMRTLQEASDGITDGMPVVVSIDNEYYHCTNELIAIKDQDDYEFPPMNMKQNLADKVEPKFKDGQWIVQENIGVYKVIEVCESWYEVVDNKDKHYSIGFDKEYMCHLWTIEDAKDGDVLAFKDDSYILLVKEVHNTIYGMRVSCYCHVLIGKFETVEYQIRVDGLYPATKEQRELLFQKMHDAGYEWDDEKKVLKKIEQKPIDKVEPKFKVGDWVVCEITGLIYQIEHCIEHLNNHKYGYILIDGRYIGSDDAEFYHLWTIQDAKDGDVLCYKDEVFLYKHDIKNCTKKETTFGGIVYYCCYDGKRFITDSLYSLSEQNKIDIHPAVKEQRDLLFTKIRETGLKWDAEKKELKMIEEEYNEKSSSKCQL